MTYPTFGDMTNEVITLLGQVSGSAVQQYSEPVVKVAINRIFDHLWDKRKWEHLWSWETKEIGASGLVTTDFEGVRSYMDIVTIRDADDRRTIPRPVETEHLYATGSRPLYVTVLPWTNAQHETRMFKFWPVGATATVEFYIGHRPDEFSAADDVIPMDRNLIVHGATWFMLADDGLNPASAEKAQVLFDVTYQNVVARLNEVNIGRGSVRDGRFVSIQS